MSSLWLWASPEASRALSTRDVAEILRSYRRLNRLSQERLARILDYDKTYISMIETRKRAISDVGALRHIAHTLAIPAHALGVTELDDATFTAMLQFAESILSLAEIARKAGRASDAVDELWPLVARLEARAVEGGMERSALLLLGRARLSLGVALGTLLPDESLASAAVWTGRGLAAAERLGQHDLITRALTMHGNELRKAGWIGAATVRLRRAVEESAGTDARAASCAMLARAAGEGGNAELFDSTMSTYRHEVDRGRDTGMLANEFTFREIRLRGLVATGRPREAARLMDQTVPTATPAAPQWAVIDRITTGDVLLGVGDLCGAADALLAGLREAEAARLPHQAQRAVRIAGAGRLDGVVRAGRCVVGRLGRNVARSRTGSPDTAPPSGGPHAS